MYQRVCDLLKLIKKLDSCTGASLEEIEEEFQVSARTAYRMLGAVRDHFGGLESIGHAGAQGRWRRRRPESLFSTSVADLMVLHRLRLAGELMMAAGLEEDARCILDLSAHLVRNLPKVVRDGIDDRMGRLVEGFEAGPPGATTPFGILEYVRLAMTSATVVTVETVGGQAFLGRPHAILHAAAGSSVRFAIDGEGVREVSLADIRNVQTRPDQYL